MSGWTLSPATADDAATLAHIHVQGWRDSYGGLVNQAYLDTLDESARAEKWSEWIKDGATQIRIARNGAGEAAGFISYGRLRTPVPGQSSIRPLYSAEIYALYILEPHWRQGLGRLLMKDAAEGLAAMKHRSVCLWVLEGNKRAVSFYKTLGGQRCGNKTVDIGGAPQKEICFGWRDSAVLLKS